MIRTLLIAGAALAFAQSASAKLDCKDPQDNLTMRQCAYEDYKAADKELNGVYAKAMAAMKSNYGPQEIKDAGGQDPSKDLKDAQRKWVAFRDANCRSLGTQMLGGSGQDTIVAGCLASMTKERVTELKTFLPE
jgi:uncharacterized protein YecT (DUF1311 family)